MITVQGSLRLVAISIAIGASSMAQQDVPATADEDVRAVLARRFEKDGPSTDELVRELVDLGVGHAPALIDVALAGEATVERRAFPTKARRARSDARDLMVGALREWPRADVLSHLADHARSADDTEDDLRTRLAVVQVLGDLGGKDLLAAVLEIVGDVDPMQLRHTYVAGRLEPALAVAFADDDTAYAELDARVEGLDPAVLACVARALARNARLRDLDALLRLVGRDESLDEDLLRALASLELRSAAPVLGTDADRLRKLVDHQDPKIQNLAVVALGRLEDVSSFGLFLKLLERDGVASQGALWSLEHVSGVRRGRDAEVWRRWYEEEVRWMTDEAPALALTLAGEDTGLAVRAARELGSHRLFRDPLVTMLVPGLDHQDEAVVTATCAALERVGGVSAATQLIALLSHSDRGVRTAARKTLTGLVGDDLGPDRERWLALFAD